MSWENRLLYGGRSGLSGAQRTLAAKYAAMLQSKTPMGANDIRVAKAIACCCGKAERSKK